MLLFVTLLGALFTGGLGLVGIWWFRRPNKQERELQALRHYLVEDEIIGHKDVPGVPDKDGLGQRTARMEIALSGIQRELYPNGGSSLADAVQETRAMMTKGTADIAAIKIIAKKAQEFSETAAQQAQVAVIEARSAVREAQKAAGTASESLTAVAAEIKTSNGLSIAALADRGEGQRIQDNIPQADRTDSQQGYVDRLDVNDKEDKHE